MKFSILLDILFDLLIKRKATAPYFAEKHGISVRTVYRYIDLLSITVPVYVKRGRDGGICISDSYKLPVGFMTKEEYDAAIESLTAMYAQLPQERFLSAMRKLSAQMKTEARELSLSGDIGTILVDGGTWGDTRSFSERLRLAEECIQSRTVLEIEYHARTGEKTQRKIEPHVLVYKQSVWYLYAFCHEQRAFRLFRLGRIFSAVKTEESFTRREVKREEIPLQFWTSEAQSVEATFAFSKDVLVSAQDWLGVENLRKNGDEWTACVSLPFDDNLIRQILALGAGVKVLSPVSLRERVKNTAQEILKTYQ
jgi:predicted DNA-binding transcriptional regulator YafY